MKINNQTPVKISILNHQGKAVLIANNGLFMSLKALMIYVKSQADFLRNKAQDQSLAHLRPKRVLIEQKNSKLSFDL